MAWPIAFIWKLIRLAGAHKKAVKKEKRRRKRLWKRINKGIKKGENVDKLKALVDGKKTYITGAVAVGIGLATIFGLTPAAVEISTAEAIQMILGGLGFITARAAIGKI